VKSYEININMSLRKFYSVAEVQEFAREQKRTIVIRDGDVLDVTTFAKHHPGKK
jgi:cytochrome b involved in lipid metabolism